MLSRKRRLPVRSGTNFKAFQGYCNFFIKAARNELGYNRFAVVISARAVKTASGRHFFKRLILHQVVLWPDVSADVLIIVRPEVRDATEETIKKELAHAADSVTDKLNG